MKLFRQSGMRGGSIDECAAIFFQLTGSALICRSSADCGRDAPHVFGGRNVCIGHGARIRAEQFRVNGVAVAETDMNGSFELIASLRQGLRRTYDLAERLPERAIQLRNDLLRVPQCSVTFRAQASGD
jgi:hypothetical protein